MKGLFPRVIGAMAVSAEEDPAPTPKWEHPIAKANLKTHGTRLLMSRSTYSLLVSA